MAAVSSLAPSFAASSPTIVTEQCQDNLPAGVGPYWPTDGSHVYSSTGGDANTNVTTAFNYGMNDASGVGSVSIYFDDGAAQSWVADPYVTMNNGNTYCGFASLGGTASFVSPSGVNSSTSVMWYGTAGLTDDALWSGVTAHLPFVYWWTDPATGTLYSAQYEMLITYPTTDAFSAGVQNMTVQFVEAPYGCANQQCTSETPVIRNVTPNYPAAGSTVTITGSGFTGATSVTYYGHELQYTVVNDTTIEAVMPDPWPAGLSWGIVYDVVVCNSTGCSDGYGIARGAN
ncbi:IPT/TIG domain-containing protein [Brachybacterium sp. EF45031]|uniref:IPT/TIG domain-containing protein n=1 Tax=Brachybacterium sillae TaxID=2810536 RepID=UPI00217D9CAB|nr:IPT/TIG domain-containing protein [Brachybacterium sillae]MCS6710955.1 IPT/TIG domain-containing protein [Brachybacterium sillae]